MDETGLIYLRARCYNPKLGQFIQADSYQGQSKDIESQNRYAYAHNNPYKNVDRNGHWIRVSSDNPYRPGENSDNYWTGKRMDALSNRKNKESDNEKDPWKKAKLEEEARKAAAYSNKLRKQMGAKPRPNNKQEKKLRPAPKCDVFGFLGKWAGDLGRTAGKILDGVMDTIGSVINGISKTLSATLEHVISEVNKIKADPGAYFGELMDNTIQMIKTPEFWAGAALAIGAAALVTVSGGSIFMASLAAGAVSNGVSALSSFEKSGYDVDRFFKEQGAENVAEYLGMFATKTAITTTTIYAGTKIKDMGSKVIGKAKSKYKKHNNNNNGATDTKADWYVGPDGNAASSLDDYDWYIGIYNNPSNVHLEGLGSTGRTIPKDVMEQAAMKDALRDPFENIPGQREVYRVSRDIGDSRWSGWEKWQIVYRTNNGRTITIHFDYEPIKGLFDDFKFK